MIQLFPHPHGWSFLIFMHLDLSVNTARVLQFEHCIFTDISLLQIMQREYVFSASLHKTAAQNVKQHFINTSTHHKW